MNSEIKNIETNLKNITNQISTGENKLNSLNNDIDSVKQMLMNHTNLPIDKIASLKDGISNLQSVSGTIVENLKLPFNTDKISSLTDKINSNYNKCSEIVGKVKNLFDDEKNKFGSLFGGKDKEDKNTEIPELSKEEWMNYDSNGLKHFMNFFIDRMKEEKISFDLLGTRRWAVDKNDEKVFGNAFLKKQSSDTYKLIDSDNKLYFLSDYNSRHFYGEAVDISGNLSDILEKVAINDNLLEIMRKFGICMQMETSESGHSKGTHFHCSTDSDNPQTKWWGIVNQIRNKKDLKMFPIISSSEYFEEETKNKIELM